MRWPPQLMPYGLNRTNVGRHIVHATISIARYPSDVTSGSLSACIRSLWPGRKLLTPGREPRCLATAMCTVLDPDCCRKDWDPALSQREQCVVDVATAFGRKVRRAYGGHKS
jgi:hypothetical protein